eukprot:10958324-Alexandrium_andersonii.AAC.1
MCIRDRMRAARLLTKPAGLRRRAPVREKASLFRPGQSRMLSTPRQNGLQVRLECVRPAFPTAVVTD